MFQSALDNPIKLNKLILMIGCRIFVRWLIDHGKTVFSLDGNFSFKLYISMYTYLNVLHVFLGS